jgi:hypothetical protein
MPTAARLCRRVEVEELDAGGAAAGGADGPDLYRRVNADDLAELGEPSWEMSILSVVWPGRMADQLLDSAFRSRSMSSMVTPASHWWRSAV